ncbi:MAG: biotin synthase BioB [Actinomycetia bacterium]|nr:biotin synthase BioB [Actinomycetes bacterium]
MSERRPWAELAQRSLAGEQLSHSDALSVLEAPGGHLLDLLAAAYRVRHHHFGNVVKLNFLINAKSGICPEDCHYCSQSRISTAEIDRYQLLSTEQILEQVDRAIELRASTCCLVTSARGPSKRELAGICEAVVAAKSRHPALKLCACLGLLDDEAARRLKAAGVDRYNHNLNTAESHYGSICSTHTFADRLQTVKAAAQAGISPCSGVIVGMGETHEQLADVAFSLRAVGADSIPINFLIPIEGTPLGKRPTRIDPTYALNVLCMFRLICPDREIRLSAGREVHLGSLQPLGLYPANAIFVSDYLTEPGQAPEADLRMIADLGFEVEELGAPIGSRHPVGSTS